MKSYLMRPIELLFNGLGIEWYAARGRPEGNGAVQLKGVLTATREYK